MGPTDAAPPALQMSEETPRCVQAPACRGAGASLCPHGRPRGDMSPQPPRGPASHQHVAWEQLPGALAAHGRSSSFIIHRRLGPAVAGFFFFATEKLGGRENFSSQPRQELKTYALAASASPGASGDGDEAGAGFSIAAPLEAGSVPSEPAFSGYPRAREGDGEVCCSVTPSAAPRPPARPRGMGGLRVASAWPRCIRAGREHGLCKVLCKQPPWAGRLAASQGWLCRDHPCPQPCLHPHIPSSSPSPTSSLSPTPTLSLPPVPTPCPNPHTHPCSHPTPGCSWCCPLPAHPHKQARAADPGPRDLEVNMEITNRLFLPAAAVSHRVP